MKFDMWKHRPSWQQNTQSAPSAAYFDIRHSLFDIRYSGRAAGASLWGKEDLLSTHVFGNAGESIVLSVNPHRLPMGA